MYARVALFYVPVYTYTATGCTVVRVNRGTIFWYFPISNRIILFAVSTCLYLKSSLSEATEKNPIRNDTLILIGFYHEVFVICHAEFKSKNGKNIIDRVSRKNNEEYQVFSIF